MTRTGFEEALSRAVAEVAETMFFTSVLAETGGPETGESSLCAGLSFDGAVSGRLALALSPQAVAAMASGFLGVDQEEVTAEQAAEVACELTNMVAGASLSAAGPNARFVLSHPEIRAGLGTGRQHWFELDAGLLGVAVWFNRGPSGCGHEYPDDGEGDPGDQRGHGDG